MIFVYITAIIVFVGAAILTAFLSNKNEKKRLKKLSENQLDEKPLEIEATSDDMAIQQPIIETKEKPVEDVPLQTEFQDFQLDKDEEIQFESTDMDEDDELDRKFAEYQKFLRENLDMDEGPEFPPEMINRFETGQYDESMGKSPDEIAEALKDMPPHLRDVLLSNALARKEFEDDDQNSN